MHMKEINKINMDGDWDNKKDKLVEELRNVKNEARTVYYSNLEKKKDLVNKHENVVLLEKKIRKMQKLLDVKKKDSPEIYKNDVDINPEDKALEDLSKRVEEATKVMEFEEKNVQIELHKQEADIKSLEHEVEIAALKLREKDQEFKLWELKIKELKRQTRHNILKPLEVEAVSSQIKTEHKSNRVGNKHNQGKSESLNIMGKLSPYKPMELTEENIRLFEENFKSLERDEEFEFYSNNEDQN